MYPGTLRTRNNSCQRLDHVHGPGTPELRRDAVGQTLTGTLPMHFFTMNRIYRNPEDAISLRDVWTIVDGELNGTAAFAWERLRSEDELGALHREVAWAAQALLEFADLLSFTRPAKGRVQYQNYLYFEATSALREATVGILNGSPRAASGLLRSVIEMLLFHCWWQKRMSRKGSSSQFYCWLEGRRSHPKFRDVVANNFEWLGIPGEGGAQEHVNRTYERLCSYVHAPIREESFTMLNRGNVGHVGVGVLRHWLGLARDVLRIALEQLVHLYPQCLFPVDITRKFGFNPPVGMYFDEFNFVPLRAVLGGDAIETRRARLKDREVVEAGRQFYESRPDLTRDQILATRDDEDGSEALGDTSDDPDALWLRAKVRNRVVLMALTYSDPLGPH